MPLERRSCVVIRAPFKGQRDEAASLLSIHGTREAKCPTNSKQRHDIFRIERGCVAGWCTLGSVGALV